jgi:signal transduction histidine kinase
METRAATADLNSEGAKLFESPTSHAGQRTIQSVGALFAALAVFQASLFVPGVARSFGVGVLDGALACGLVIVGATVGNGAYWLSGLSRLYFWAEYAESWLSAAGYSYLIYASGTPQSFFWFLYLAHVFVISSGGTNLRNSVLIGVAPAAIALGFGLKGQLATAIVCLAAGGFGVALYLIVGRSSDELEKVRRREVELKGNLARLRVAQERDRIARDLHDGVGAQLAGLVWRVRGMASGSASQPSPAELATLERRVLDTIDEVRDVVLALRREPMSWDETTELLKKRGQEMCGSIPFELRVEGAPDRATLDRVFSDVIRIVFELVRNAIRHAAPSRVEVSLESAGGLRLRVSDDGRGFQSAHASRSQGGLSSVRQRVDDLGGHMDIGSDTSGTRIEIVLPALPSETSGP